jgi:DNA-binding MarR family transcriptional regulator
MIQVKDLSEKAKISRPALNEILNKLEARELIERIRLGDDRKSVYVKLGKNAHSIYDDEKEKMIEVLNRIVEKFGQEETHQMIQSLNKLREIVEEEVKRSC